MDLSGVRFGRLVAIVRVKKPGSKKVWYDCKCDCGGSKTTCYASLVDGLTQSCGCIRKERPPATTHGLRNTLSYLSWGEMVRRCTNPNHKAYGNYGGRGITVCKRWLDVRNFIADMGERRADQSLDRIDNDKGYSPENCRWTDRTTQNNNRRVCRYITHNGVTHTAAEWSRILGVNVQARLDKGWSEERAITQPKRH